MGLFNQCCDWCWDYHCDNCAPEGCRVKEAAYQDRLESERQIRSKIEMEEKIKAMDEDNDRRYAEYLARNGGVTDFERISANFKRIDNENSKD